VSTVRCGPPSGLTAAIAGVGCARSCTIMECRTSRPSGDHAGSSPVASRRWFERSASITHTSVGSDETVRTDRFSVLWPPGPEPHRVLASALRAAEALASDVAGTMVVGGESRSVPRFAAPAPGRATTGAIEAMALYAGQGVGEVREVRPAAEIVATIVADAEARLAAPAC